MENNPNFEKSVHVIHRALRDFIAKNIDGEPTKANDLNHTL